MIKKTLSFAATSFICSLLINVCAQSPSWQWAIGSGGRFEDRGSCISTDPAGNSYVTGFFYSPDISFGNVTLTNPDQYGNSCDAFIAKMNSAGDVIWAKNTFSAASGSSIATDASGHFYLTGEFHCPSITFDTITFNNGNGHCMYLAKYDTSSGAEWAKIVCGDNNTEGQGITSDNSGNIYVTGRFSSSFLVFDSDTVHRIGGSADIFIVKYDSSGNVVWAKSAGGSGTDIPVRTTTDNIGNIYIMGYFTSPVINFDTVSITNPTLTEDIFIAKFNSSGNGLWAKRFGGTGMDAGNGICTDAYGNIFLTGGFRSSSIAFDSITFNNPGGNNYKYYVVKLDNSGNVKWANHAISNSQEAGTGIAADISGDCYVAGTFSSLNITLGNIALINAGNNGYYNDVFIVKYDSSGNALWAKSAGGTGNESSSIIGCDASGNCYLTGNFQSQPAVFGNFVLANADTNNFGFADIFVAKLDGHITGIKNEPELENAIKIFPNPSSASVKIQIPGQSGTIKTMEIFDCVGQLQFKRTVNFSDIDIRSLKSGLYFIVLTNSDNDRIIGKIIKE